MSYLLAHQENLLQSFTFKGHFDPCYGAKVRSITDVGGQGSSSAILLSINLEAEVHDIEVFNISPVNVDTQDTDQAYLS